MVEEMKCRFSINDKVEIVLRDETAIGFVDKIDERGFHVIGKNNKDLGWYPNDVGNYVRLINQN